MLSLAARCLAALSLVVLSPRPAAADEPMRLLSLGGSVTEIVYALGAGDRLVGVDSTSLHPPEARALPDVGYLRRLSAEPVLSLAPTLILAEADAGPPPALEQLRAAGVETIVLPDQPDIAGVQRKIGRVAAALGLEQRGAALAARVGADYDRVAARIAGATGRPRVMFVLSAGHGAPLVAGEETSAAAIIGLAGGINAIQGFRDYRPLSPEAGIAAAPDVILVTGRTLDLVGGVERLQALPGVAGTPAAASGAIVALDGLLLLGFGPRTPEAVAMLARALHPALDLAE